jgi:hypothetical protein
VPSLGFLLVPLCIVVCFLPPFLEFTQLHLPFDSGSRKIHMPHLDSPVWFVFQFYG